MTIRTNDLFSDLNEIHRRPAPFSTYTAEQLWNDEHISRNMLAFHLDSQSEPASRPHDFIDRSADWIIRRFELADGPRVADLGCGPGLYATRFAAAGARVTGVDFSRRSIAYAQEDARHRDLEIEYVQANYLDAGPVGEYDLITLIYCDLCPLSPAQRRVLLARLRDLLAPGGSVLLDVFTAKAYASREETTDHAHRLMGGFWASGEYWGFQDTFKYDDEQIVLDKYTIVEPQRIRTVYNWLQYFTPERLTAEFAACGLRITGTYGNVAGDPCDEGDVMAVVVQKV